MYHLPLLGRSKQPRGHTVTNEPERVQSRLEAYSSSCVPATIESSPAVSGVTAIRCADSPAEVASAVAGVKTLESALSTALRSPRLRASRTTGFLLALAVASSLRSSLMRFSNDCLLPRFSSFPQFSALALAFSNSLFQSTSHSVTSHSVALSPRSACRSVFEMSAFDVSRRRPLCSSQKTSATTEALKSSDSRLASSARSSDDAKMNSEFQQRSRTKVAVSSSLSSCCLSCSVFLRMLSKSVKSVKSTFGSCTFGSWLLALSKRYRSPMSWLPRSTSSFTFCSSVEPPWRDSKTPWSEYISMIGSEGSFGAFEVRGARSESASRARMIPSASSRVTSTTEELISSLGECITRTSTSMLRTRRVRLPRYSRAAQLGEKRSDIFRAFFSGHNTFSSSGAVSPFIFSVSKGKNCSRSVSRFDARSTSLGHQRSGSRMM